MPNQPTKWTINAGGQGSGPNNLDLVGCQIAKVTDANGNLQYAFIAPGVGSGPPSQASITLTGTKTSYPATPFQFPLFNSALSQGQSTGPYNWYITVCTLTGGASGNQGSGTYSNTGPVACGGSLMGDPPDTWVATANTTAEEEEASAASG